jgi:hypothetical protein
MFAGRRRPVVAVSLHNGISWWPPCTRTSHTAEIRDALNFTSKLPLQFRSQYHRTVYLVYSTRNVPLHIPAQEEHFYIKTSLHVESMNLDVSIITEWRNSLLKVWDSHKTQLFCGRIGLRIDLLVWQHVSTPSIGSSSGLQHVSYVFQFYLLFCNVHLI